MLGLTFLRTNHRRCWVWLSLLNWIEALNYLHCYNCLLENWHLDSFYEVSFSSEVVLYLYKSTKRSCMEYCCHVRASAPSCCLELLDKIPKRICRTVGPSLAASFEPLTPRRHVSNLSLFYSYYFGKCSSELVQLVSLPYSRGTRCYKILEEK